MRTYFSLIKADSTYFIEVLFKQDLIELIIKYALSNQSKTKHICIKILSFLTTFPEYEKKFALFNPLYTFNSVLAGSLIEEKTRILALDGIKFLAANYKSLFIETGIIATLLTILNESEETIEL